MCVLMCFAAGACSVVAQGDWVTGEIATNYGSAFDKLSPWEPSFGTSVVRIQNPGQHTVTCASAIPPFTMSVVPHVVHLVSLRVREVTSGQ